jgi:hypothetical protein
MLGRDNDPMVISVARGMGETLTLGNDNSPWCKAISIIATVCVEPSF